jgi:hypothetical protein
VDVADEQTPAEAGTELPQDTSGHSDPAVTLESTPDTRSR